MPRSTWMTAAGIAGALAIAGTAVVAVASTGPPPDATPSSSASSSPTFDPSPGDTPEPSPSASTTNTPEATVPSPHATRTPEGVPDSADTAVSAAEAVEIAGGELAGGGSAPPVDRLDLKFEDGRLIWDVEFVGDHKVEVDATTGAIVKFELGDDDRDDNSGRGSGDDDGDDNSGRGRGGDDHGDDDGDDNSGRGGHDDGPNHD